MENATAENISMCDFDPITSSTGVSMLLCSCVGVLLNIVSMVIFNQRIMHSPINLLLAALCAEDVIVLVLAVPILGLTNIEATCLIRIANFDYFYSMSVLYMYPVMMMAQSASVWTFVLISVERFYVICRPLHRHRWFSKRKASRAVCSVGILAVCCNFIRFWQYKLDKYGLLVGGLIGNVWYYRIYYTGAYVLFMFVVPFALLLVLNASLVRAIYKSARNNVILGTEADVRSRRIKQQQKVTLMVVLVTVFFAMCNTLPFVLNIWEAMDPSLFSGSNGNKLSFYLLDVSNLLVLINCSIGPLFYLCFCDRYRNLSVAFLTCSHIPGNTQPQSEAPYTTFNASGDRVRSNSSTDIRRANSTGKLRRAATSKNQNGLSKTRSYKMPIVKQSMVRMEDYPHRRLSDDFTNRYLADQIMYLI